MTQLMSVQCPCGALFEAVPQTAISDEDGNWRCDNCAVEMGLKEGLDEEPPAEGPVPEPEGADAELPSDDEPVDVEPAEAPEEPLKAVEVEGEVFVPKVDLRTKEGRALKAAGLA